MVMSATAIELWSMAPGRGRVSPACWGLEMSLAGAQCILEMGGCGSPGAALAPGRANADTWAGVLCTAAVCSGFTCLALQPIAWQGRGFYCKVCYLRAVASSSSRAQPSLPSVPSSGL